MFIVGRTGLNGSALLVPAFLENMNFNKHFFYANFTIMQFEKVPIFI